MNTLLLSSGGMKGYIFLGVWKYIQEKNIEIKTFSGVSIGAFFNMWFALGYTFDEIYNSIIDLNLMDLFHFDFTGFFDTYGLIDIEPFETFIYSKIEEKGFDKNITFKELYDQTGKDLHTYSICVNTQELVRFDKENTPNCPIWKAVKMSMSIPLIFPPISYNNQLYIDGALKNGFPIDFYDKNKTISCQVTEKSKININSFFDYMYNVVKASLIRPVFCNKENCIIFSDIKTLDISIPSEKIDEMIQLGYDSISMWMDGNIDSQ